MENSSDYYEAIFESIGTSIIIVDETSKIVMMNRRTEDYFGYAKEELIGQKIEKLIPERYRTNHEKLRDDYSKKPENRPMGTGRELLALKKDGSELPVEIGLNPARTSKGMIVIITCIDISKRRALEEERDELFLELKEALDNVKTLKGMLPICMSCKKVRDDEGYWEKVDSYIVKHSDATITHGLCPDCAEKLYPDFYKEKK
jgi:PAS domain S-box-containing protein